MDLFLVLFEFMKDAGKLQVPWQSTEPELC